MAANCVKIGGKDKHGKLQGKMNFSKEATCNSSANANYCHGTYLGTDAPIFFSKTNAAGYSFFWEKVQAAAPCRVHSQGDSHLLSHCQGMVTFNDLN